MNGIEVMEVLLVAIIILIVLNWYFKTGEKKGVQMC